MERERGERGERDREGERGRRGKDALTAPIPVACILLLACNLLKNGTPLRD